MSDLADFELAELRSGEPDADQCERAAREIERHRAARDADAERVRSVVRDAVKAWVANHTPSATDAERMIAGEVMATAIAARAAEQLAGAGVGLSADDIAQLRHHIADHRATCSYSCSLIDRLLTSPPAPDHTAAICALLDSDMPAGDLRKAMAELVGRR